jgi:RNA polymerase sigma factor (sigma-70 family)
MEAVLRVEQTDGLWPYFSTHYPRLYSLIWSWTRAEHHEVEELVQDTLVHAWRDRASFRGDAGFFSWLASIARHRLLERRRRDERRDRAEVFARSLAQLDAVPLPDDACAHAEVKSTVWAAMERVGPEYADVLAAHYVDGRSVRDMAAETGETEKAVESRLHRAREAFRRALGRNPR